VALAGCCLLCKTRHCSEPKLSCKHCVPRSVAQVFLSMLIMRSAFMLRWKPQCVLCVALIQLPDLRPFVFCAVLLCCCAAATWTSWMPQVGAAARQHLQQRRQTLKR
jgi:hypothetical protein